MIKHEFDKQQEEFNKKIQELNVKLEEFIKLKKDLDVKIELDESNVIRQYKDLSMPQFNKKT